MGILTIDTAITGLGDLRSSLLESGDRGSDAEVCQEAVNILYTLLDSGVHTIEEAKDLVHDYNALAKQYQAMYERFGTAGHAVHKDSIWHCPNCNRKVTLGHSFCHWCGKKME